MGTTLFYRRQRNNEVFFFPKKMQLAFLFFSLALCLLTNASPSGYHKKGSGGESEMVSALSDFISNQDSRLSKLENKQINIFNFLKINKLCCEDSSCTNYRGNLATTKGVTLVRDGTRIPFTTKS